MRDTANPAWLRGLQSVRPVRRVAVLANRMISRIRKYVKWFLLIWGGISFAATVGLAVYLPFWVKGLTHDKIDSASPQNVRYVLAECHLGGKQIERVVHSHIGAKGPLNGGYIDAFAIKISQVDEVDFVPKKENPNEHWYRGDQLPPVLDAAVKLVAQWHNEFPWLPSETELRSSDVHVYPVDFYGCCGSVEPTMATLVFVRKADNMMFYFRYRP